MSLELSSNSSDNLYKSKDVIKSNGRYGYSVIPARYVFVFLAFLGFCLVYAFKVVLSVTIVVMVKSKKNDNQRSNECVEFFNATAIATTTVEPQNHGTYDWDSKDQALVLGAIFYGYVITQLPAGLLSQRYGSKWVFGISIFIATISTFLGPVSAHWGLAPFFITRFITGLGIGSAYPCMATMFGRWAPKMERGLMATIVFTGSNIGTVITLPLAGYLCDTDFLNGWPSMYYILGIAGCIWFVLWAFLIHETPESHPYISQKEYDFIIKGQGTEKVTLRPKVPWKDIFTSVPVYALIITHIGNNWGYLTILTELPSYFKNILNLNIKKNGLMSSFPYLLQALMGWAVGYFGDKLRQSGKVRVNVIRKVCNSISFIGPALCLIAVSLINHPNNCNSTLTIVFFAFAMGFNGFNYSGFNATHVDMTPDFAGTIFGMTNSIANLGGFLAPLVVSALTESNYNLKQWSIVFYISAGVYMATALVYVLFASADLQPWGLSKKDESETHIRVPSVSTVISRNETTIGNDNAKSGVYDNQMHNYNDLK